ncbi:hypothetical protein BVRB_8g185410 [Beta vulgaris subsp. vulgaris]|nr:hypothetical protein BVRB_8g185410 [Beta vulgaris subsp. vulgaris]
MSPNIMQERRRRRNKSKSSTGGCKSLCCSNCRTSTEEGSESSGLSDRYASISSLAHFLVQEQLDQMIKESEEDQARRLMEARKKKQKMKVVKHATTSNNSSISNNNSRLLLMLAMEKSSDDPREDFRRSMVEVILANRIKDSKDLRYILKCYISMNSVEYRGIILEVFYQSIQT